MQNNITQQILNLEPDRELKFKGSFTRSMAMELKITNPSEERVCFKIKTTAPKQYTVRPSNGVLDPEAVSIITITLHPFDYDSSAKYSHKFMVQSIVVPEGSFSDVDELWLHASPEDRMDSKLRCTLEYIAEIKQTPPNSPYGFNQIDENITRQRLLDENVKLKVEGSRLREMVIQEQDRFVALRAEMSHRNDGRIVIMCFFFLLVGAVTGYWLAKLYW